VYSFLTQAVKSRFIEEIRRYWSEQPQYRDLPQYIQGKYAFDERPQYGIILKGSSANMVPLAADNFMGTLESYITLTKVRGKPGRAIEWVREDSRRITREGFPSPAGVYYIEIVECDPDVGARFLIDPLLNEKDETVVMLDPKTGQLGRGKFTPGSLRLFLMPGSIELFEGINYVADPETGEINLLNITMDNSSFLSADYRWLAPTQGPFDALPNHANNDAIPGCVLVFGRAFELGDQMAVLVNDRRCLSTLVYGGKWDVSLDFDVMARDIHAQEEITDQTITFLYGIARSRLSSDGIEMEPINMGGEAEEIYDETGGDYFYNATFSLTAQTDWEIHVPIVATIRRLTPMTQAQMLALAALSDAQVHEAETNLRMVEDLGLQTLEDPYYRGRRKTFETIR